MRTLATLLLGGAILLGCGEKPQPKLFVDPITGERIQELTIVKEEKPVKEEPVRQYEKPKITHKETEEKKKLTSIVYNGEKYIVKTGQFFKTNFGNNSGIVLESKNKAYGLVPVFAYSSETYRCSNGAERDIFELMLGKKTLYLEKIPLHIRRDPNIGEKWKEKISEEAIIFDGNNNIKFYGLPNSFPLKSFGKLDRLDLIFAKGKLPDAKGAKIFGNTIAMPNCYLFIPIKIE